MSDDSQNEFDDELLSAYLDDELSPDERARVESRLAVDPAARQALEQLRNVSQAVRDLPREVVGHDLRESILRRAEAAGVPGPRLGADMKQTSGDMPTQSRGNGTLPKLTIGRTPRGWMWASMAVAAALLIMVVQSGDERDAALPEVAQQDDKAVEKLDGLARRSDEFRVAREPVSPDKAPALSAASESEPVASDMDEGLAARAPAPSAESSSISGGARVNRHSASVESELSDGSAVVELDATTAPEHPVEEEDVVVVHVLAKRAAMENKAFDQLLANNGIVVEPESQEVERANAPIESQNRETPLPASGRVAGRVEDQAAFDDAACDIVLVEAPPTTIYSCMSDLNKDSNNYLSVSVDDAAATEEIAALAAPFTKKLATDLGKYSRGIVPQRFKDSLPRDKAAYYNFEASGASSSEGTEVGGGFGGTSGPNQQARQSFARGSERELGRARRVVPQRNVSRPEQLAIGDATEQVEQRSLAAKQLRELKTPAADQRLQVLFVLGCPDEPAPSAATSDRAE